jgi:polysaccharide biosynthesis transport protein
MTFGQFLSILRARWLVVVAVMAVTVTVATVISLLLPKEYSANASVVIDFKPDPVAAVMYGGVPSPAVMATQVDIINSERVAMRVVRNLRLAENAQVREQWQAETNGEGTIEQWLVALFQKKLDVQPARDSSVITIGYKAPEPRFAAGVANAFVQAYVETALELRVNPARQYSSFFEAKTKESRDALEKAQAKVSAFQKENDIIATDERLDVENARLSELSSQLIMLQALASESRSRQAQAITSSSDRLQEVLTNPLLANLRVEITRAEGKMQELTSRLGDNNPQVIEARANLNSLRERLETETKRVTGGVAVASRINNDRERQLAAALEAQRTKVLRMKAVRDEGLVLQRELENAQRAFDGVQQRHAQTSLESATTQSNVNVLTQATPPLLPSFPKLPLNIALAVFLGLLLAVGTALAMELMDRRVRTAEDLITVLNLPVIASMPRPGAKRLLGGRRPSAMQERLLAPLSAPATKEA